MVVLNYNGLSEWQHFNGLNMNEGNVTLTNNSMGGKGTNREMKSKKGQDEVPHANDRYDLFLESTRDYLFRDSAHVSHSDAVTDMALLEANSRHNEDGGKVPLLITAGRDCKVKIWR